MLRAALPDVLPDQALLPFGLHLCPNHRGAVSTAHRPHLPVLHGSSKRIPCPRSRRSHLHLTLGSTNTDPLPTRSGTNVQRGANYTRTLVTALMGSSSWSSSVFFFTFDESGGLYDHVSPQPAARSRSQCNRTGRPPSELRLFYGEGSDLQFHIYRLSHTPGCHLPICEEELRLPHSRGFHGDSEVHRNAVRSASPHQPGCGADGYDRVLQFQQSAVDVSARGSSTKPQQSVLFGQGALGPVNPIRAIARPS